MLTVVLIPVYNERKSVLVVLEGALVHADRVVVVDDGSTDGSAELVAGFARRHQGVTFIGQSRNLGYSGALLTGFVYLLEEMERDRLDADDLVVMTDADGQLLPEQIPDVRKKMLAEGLDLVLGKRDLSGYPLSKRVGNWGLSYVARLLTGFPYRDVECGFRVMRLRVLADILPYYAGLRYSCSQEIGVLAARRHFHIANDFATHVARYRPGARARDGVTNLYMGVAAAARVSLGRRFDPRPLAARPVAEIVEGRLEASQLRT